VGRVSPGKELQLIAMNATEILFGFFKFLIVYVLT
jgi:hypothetical protein